MNQRPEPECKVVDLLDFLRTGTFGIVRFGIGRAELQKLLGSADDISVPRRRERHPTIFKYGDIEFYIDPRQDRLYAIHSDNFTVIHGSTHLHLHTHGIDNHTSLMQMKNVLARADIRYSERVDEFGETRLVTEGGVTLAFNDESVEPVGGLAAISCSNHNILDIPEPTKQISIMIPEKVYESIRQEALRKRTSIAKLCSLWIVQAAQRHDSESGQPADSLIGVRPRSPESGRELTPRQPIHYSSRWSFLR